MIAITERMEQTRIQSKIPPPPPPTFNPPRFLPLIFIRFSHSPDNRFYQEDDPDAGLFNFGRTHMYLYIYVCIYISPSKYITIYLECLESPNKICC